jgi:M6 family metalloprotease-like protein
MNSSVSIKYLCLVILASISLTSLASGTDLPEAVGRLRFAVVLLDYVDDGTAPSIDSIREGLFDSEYSVNSFIKEASYGKTSITGDIFGWIRPPQQLYGPGWTSCWPEDKDRFNLLIDNYPEVILTDYDGFIFYVYRDYDPSCTAGVANTYGVQPIMTFTSFGTIDTRILYLATEFNFPYRPCSRITNSTAAHELIHALGISNHSNSFTCEDEILSAYCSDYCTVNSYGDIFAIMGLRSQASHPNAVTKERLGWLDDGSILEVNRSGQYVINSFEDQTRNTKAIKIPLKTPIPVGSSPQMDYIYLEYRGMTGFDERDPLFRNIELDNGRYHRIDNIHGALVHGADCSAYDYCIPFLLNMHPNSVDASYSPNRLANAYLLQGERFEVPLNDIIIEVVDVDQGHSLTVNIQYSR